MMVLHSQFLAFINTENTHVVEIVLHWISIPDYLTTFQVLNKWSHQDSQPQIWSYLFDAGVELFWDKI